MGLSAIRRIRVLFPQSIRSSAMSIPSFGGKVRGVLVKLGVAAACVAGAYQVLQITPAYAATRHTVCASSLYVRNQPLGATIGTLFQGETFDVERYDSGGGWAYGMAYGHVNQHGWVQNGWFCQ
jgi:hypothetical protein